MSALAFKTIGLIGFGEAGGILGADLARQFKVRMYDILLDDPAHGDAMRAKAASAGVEIRATHADAVRGADLVIAAVTAASSGLVAATVGPHLKRGQIYLDINSVSPEAKRANAAAVEASGADYVEAAVMAAIGPKRIAVPMLLGGRRANELAAALAPIGFDATAVADTIGVASAIKMCRSVMIKGLEALTIECLLGARRYGAEAQVLASLHGTFPSMGWDKELPDYLVGRVAEHGRRRAAEMREAAATLEDGGIAPRMATATAGLHDWFAAALAERGLAFKSNAGFDWRQAVDPLLDCRTDAANRARATADR
ncbi:MAG: DUF1932 domain-containing protein [Alphaproteobacteria bacterium]